MKKLIVRLALPLLALFGVTVGITVAQNSKDAGTGTLETSIVAGGTIALDLDLSRLDGTAPAKEMRALRFEAAGDSYFPIMTFREELRGPLPGTIALRMVAAPELPAPLQTASDRLVLERREWSEPHAFVIRDGKTGFVFFQIEAPQFSYDAKARTLTASDGRVQLSEEFARNLGRPAEANAVVGNFSMTARMRVIEARQIDQGVAQGAVLPRSDAPSAANGPDVIVGDLPTVAQSGTASGTRVGIVVATTSCNNGNVELNWLAMPNTDHPVIPQNLYRMSGGVTNDERFEQIGQSWLKHAFTALQQNACGFGCSSSGTGTRLGVGCSDPYGISENQNQASLGSRAWVNPFTGVFPTTARDHSGHTHDGTSHRTLVEINDLATNLNPGATYFAEGQYVTPHEYAWCQSHPGECNMYNNVSYRRFNVVGLTSPFTFQTVAGQPTVREKAAIEAWTGATIARFEPAPGVDGVGYVGYKVSGPTNGMYHYEYAVYNQNLDRAIQAFTVPLGCGVQVSNVGFHAPPNHPVFANDNIGGTGLSNATWATSQAGNKLTWSSETFAQNANANALRWGTLYNFRFDSPQPPAATTATVGFFKTGAPINVAIQGPMATCAPLSVASAVSRKTHGGAGVFDVPLPLSGEPGVECRSGGTGNNHSLVVTFSNNVVSGNATVTEGTATPGTPVFSGNTMTVDLSGVSNAQKVTVSLDNVTDEFSQTLPATVVSMNVLLGDVNGNKAVNGSDVGQTKAASGATLDGSNFRADVNASGGVNGTDIGQVKAAVGQTIP